MASSILHIVPTIRALVVISYFALTIFFYTRAPSGASLAASGFPSIPSGYAESGSKYESVGAFGEMMIAMLGPTDVPFTLFVPSHAAFLNISSIFRKIEEKGEKLDVTDTESPIYAVMSHLLSFSAVPKPILSKHVPVGKELVHESLSGFLLSLSRVRGTGLLVNNVTCAVTDLQRGRFVIHVLNGALMDFDFEQSMLQESAPGGEEDSKEEVDQEEDVSEDQEQQSHI
ncbi:hypothetical protein M758_4G161600 [Ceratodon purpureus]|uniref:FAS1 domain-containing protein n=1 Tax=Ceratodon purpureus TaxID=3225 RepID=A0A8T0IBE2_CERPU|nr:hypothetical protein KC19_4G160900 [Ceratodon purpureus]KAG0619744.1 hypothetical protein M758_4G161600 [Ceratodon purpureus]